MNEGSIWWKQLGASRRFLKRIRESMEAADSVVLHVPAKMPWPNYFYSMVDMQKASFSGDRQIQRLEWQPGEDPGAFILNRLCTRLVQAEYFPSQTYAEYLGGRNDILLCDYYVWVKGVRSREDLARWIDFIVQYNGRSGAFQKRAIFMIEYSGPTCSTGQVTCIPLPLERLDLQVFCLELASELNNAHQRDFQAELALRIGEGDPELSALLMSSGEGFIQDPVGVAQSFVRKNLRSDYSRFDELSSEQISSAVWKADIVLLFPILEQWRFNFVTRNAETLRGYLPIRNSNGEKVEEPLDLELGSLLYIATQNQPFTKAEYEQLKLCRTVRNKLAHNQVIPADEACAVLKLK